MRILKKNISMYIPLLHNNEDIFIQVLDKYYSGFHDKLDFYMFSEDNSFFVNNKGHIYLSDMDNRKIELLNNFLVKENITIFSIYGKSQIIETLNSLIDKTPQVILDYYVMEIQKTDFKPAEYKSDQSYNLRFCNIFDYYKLKKLQILYHLEEVYAGTDKYPKELELKSFKKILSSRENYALFIGNLPVSKVYINAKSTRSCQLGGIYTLKKFRGNGFAKTCITDFIDQVFKKYSYLNKVQLFVKRKNTAAVELYKKIGFKIKEKTSVIYY